MQQAAPKETTVPAPEADQNQPQTRATGVSQHAASNCPESAPELSPAEPQQTPAATERPISSPSQGAPAQPVSAPGIDAPHEPAAPSSPDPPPAPKASPQVRLDELLDTFNRRSDIRIVRSGQELRLHLDPDDLGRLRVEIRSDEQRGVQAFIRVETDAARIALESRLGSLKAVLTRSGITFGGLEVSVGGGQDHRPERHSRPRRRTPETSSVLESETTTSTPRRASHSPGQLDLVV